MKLLFVIFMSCFCLFSLAQDTTRRNPNDTVPANGTGNQTGEPGFGEDENENDEDEATSGGKEKANVLGALLNYNFSGNKKGLSNFTPVIDYGWTKTFTGKKEKGKGENETKIFKWDLSINPYAAGQIDVTDSSSFLPALMLPGVAGLKVNAFLRFKIGKGEIIWAPVNLGYKLLSNFADSNTIIAQHNVRTAIGYTHDDLFTFGIQYTHGWHNSTSESENMFRKVFSTDVTDIGYFLVSLQTKLTNEASKTPTYLFAEWRGMVTKNKYIGFDNRKIITFGIRTDMKLDYIAPARGPRRL